MIFPQRWKEVPVSARVIDPAGNVFHVLPQIFPNLAQLRGVDGKTHCLPIDPESFVPRLYDPEDQAIDCLRRHFTLEPLRST